MKRETAKKTSVLGNLIPLLGLYPWGIPSIILLGILSSLAEGVGISLFIPFIRSLDSTTGFQGDGIWLVDSLNRLFCNVAHDDRLMIISLCILGSVLLKATLSFGNCFLYGWLDARISHRLRSGIFEQLLSVSFRFWDRTTSGRLLNILSTETWRTSQAIQVFVQLIISFCLLLVYTTLLMLISWKLTLIVSVVMLAISLVVRFLTGRVKGLGEKATQVNAALAGRMIEGIHGIRVIRAFGREPYEQDRFDKSSRRVSRIFMKLGIFAGVVHPVYEVLAAALLVCILYTSLPGQENLAALLVFIFVLYRLQPRVKAIDASRVALNSMAASVGEVVSLLDRSDKPYVLSGGTPSRGVKESIVLDKVTFRYGSGEKPALRDVSLRIPAGKTTAFVGPSGGGKSTLIKLLLRFYDVTEGAIRIDGTSIEEFDPASWRGRTALVSQDVFIFNTTVRDNIAYGRLDATEEEIFAAARQADAHDFITALPEGYDTVVGDRGTRLSGGQQQRVTLARAIVRDPEILILDEATNALDSLSEQLIQNTLETLRDDRTVIVIAHRLSTIERADHIVVLEQGQVREEGDLGALLKRGGLFARLHSLQFRGLHPAGEE